MVEDISILPSLIPQPLIWSKWLSYLAVSSSAFCLLCLFMFCLRCLILIVFSCMVVPFSFVCYPVSSFLRCSYCRDFPVLPFGLAPDYLVILYCLGCLSALFSFILYLVLLNLSFLSNRYCLVPPKKPFLSCPPYTILLVLSLLSNSSCLVLFTDSLLSCSSYTILPIFTFLQVFPVLSFLYNPSFLIFPVLSFPL
jgi:hypothetical protein